MKSLGFKKLFHHDTCFILHLKRTVPSSKIGKTLRICNISLKTNTLISHKAISRVGIEKFVNFALHVSEN